MPVEDAEADGLTQRLSSFVSGLSVEDVPAAAFPTVKTFILDALGTGCVGTGSALATGLYQLLDAEAGHGNHFVLGRSAGTSASWAAFGNATLMHADDYDDSPHTCFFLPALLATAQETHATGRELCAAWAIAYDIWDCLLPALSMDRYFNPPLVVVPIAAALACGWLRRLNADQLVMAIGIAASHSGGLERQFGTHTKPLEAGRSAQAGVVAARLAEYGWTADRRILEGWKGWTAAFGGPKANLAHVEDQLGRFANLVSGKFGGATAAGRAPFAKPWPCCARAFSSVAATLAAMAGSEKPASDIASVDIQLPFDPRLTAVFRSSETVSNGYEAKFSIPYLVAAACIERDITLSTFLPDGFARVIASGLIEKVSIRSGGTAAVTGGRVSSTDQSGTSVVIRWQDGRETFGTVSGRGVSLGRSDIETKFRANAKRLISSLSAEDAVSLINRLEQLPLASEILTPFRQ